MIVEIAAVICWLLALIFYVISWGVPSPSDIRASRAAWVALLAAVGLVILSWWVSA